MKDGVPAYIQEAIKKDTSLNTLFNYVVGHGQSETTAINYVDAVRDYAAWARKPIGPS